MWFFTKPLSKPATTLQANPAIDELQSIEEKYCVAEKEFSKACHDVLRYQQANREASSLMLVGNRAFQRVNGGILNPRPIIEPARGSAATRRKGTVTP